MKIKLTDTSRYNLEGLTQEDLSVIIETMRHCAIDPHGSLPSPQPLAAAFSRLSQAVSEFREKNFDGNQK